MNNSIPGLSINSTTSVISWTRDLPVELAERLQITATNSSGPTSRSVDLFNSFQGVFSGFFDGNTYYELEFSQNGILLVRDEFETTPYTYIGSWTIDGNTVMGDYWDEATADKFSVLGELTIGTNVTYTGNWYYEYGAISGNEGGTVALELD